MPIQDQTRKQVSLNDWNYQNTGSAVGSRMTQAAGTDDKPKVNVNDVSGLNILLQNYVKKTEGIDIDGGSF